MTSPKIPNKRRYRAPRYPCRTPPLVSLGDRYRSGGYAYAHTHTYTYADVWCCFR